LACAGGDDAAGADEAGCEELGADAGFDALEGLPPPQAQSVKARINAIVINTNLFKTFPPFMVVYL
jgi:hypothetical protein